MHILHLPTGGTIDAERYETPSNPPALATVRPISRAAAYLAKEARHHNNMTVTSLPFCSLDSKLFGEAENNLLYETVQTVQRKCDRIVITTGTDRMAEITRALEYAMLGASIPIIFTGAMLPLANGFRSDGYPNLRRAAFGLPDLKPGIYVAVGDLVEESPFVKKDFERKAFYSIRSGQRCYAL